MSEPGAAPSASRRWLFVAGVGVVCGGLLAWLFWSLTGAGLASAAIGVAVAAILVVLAVAGGRYNQTFRVTADRRSEALAKRARVRQAIEDTHRRP